MPKGWPGSVGMTPVLLRPTELGTEGLVAVLAVSAEVLVGLRPMTAPERAAAAAVVAMAGQVKMTIEVVCSELKSN